MFMHLHATLEEGLDGALPEPGGSYFEIVPRGPIDAKLREIREVVEQAKARGLTIEVNASLETMRKCGLHAQARVSGAPIFTGGAEDVGHVRFRFSSRVKLTDVKS
jgi:hypothetical protein